jgi:L-seryl-tRNA(Ser) seleniumtransferase
MRALGVYKLILSALEATLKGYLSPGELIQENPTFRMLTEPEESVKLQAERFLTRLLAIKPDWLVNAEVKPSYAQAGSGALPLEKIPSYAVHIKSRDSVENFARKLRTANPPIIGTVQNDELVLDFRTIREDELSLVLSELQFSV